MELQHLLHEGRRCHAAVAFDGGRDPHGLGPSFCLADVVVLAWQPHQQHGHEAGAYPEADEEQP